MKRIATPTKALDLFGPGKHGFKNGDLANGIQPTDLEADWFNQVQEELARLPEGAGIELDGNVRTQLLQAVRRMTGGNVRTVTAGNTVLTADDAGLVLVDGTAGAVTIALPLANVLKALPLTFRRIDATANSVTVSVAGTGADVIDEGGSSFALLGHGDVRKVVSDGTAGWATVIGPFSSAKAATGYQRLPNGLVLQWGNSMSDLSGQAAITFPLAFPSVCFSICVTTTGAIGTSNSTYVWGMGSKTPTSFSAWSTLASTLAMAPEIGCNWLAIGN